MERKGNLLLKKRTIIIHKINLMISIIKKIQMQIIGAGIENIKMLEIITIKNKIILNPK